jgi:hypothetical protein
VHKKGTTKRQHYVPQMILRRFSRNETTTSLLVLSTGKIVESAPINRQCYEPYFYGADQGIEQVFAEEEGKIARHLGDLSAERLNAFSDDVLRDLVRFVYYQQARTRAAAEHLSNFTTAFIKSAARTTAKLNKATNFDHRKLESIRLRNAQNQSVLTATKMTPILLDLALKFVVTDRTPGFVIGDHPVVAYNQFAEHHPVLQHYPTLTGLALKGLQLFMPLSPSVMVAIYDPATYEYGGKSRICRAGPQDVRFLNQMQAVNAPDLIRVRRAHPSHFTKNVSEGAVTQSESGEPRQFVIVTHRDIKVGAKFSFIRTLDFRSYEDHRGPTIPTRSPELVELTEQYRDFVEEKMRQRAEASDED